MAVRMSTYRRQDRARENHALTRAVNGARKRKERAARDRRMMALIAKGTFPYTPAIQSWLSQKAGIPFRQMTEADVRAVLGQ